MDEVLEGTPEKNMPQPDGIVTVRINRDTGLIALPNEKGAIVEYFREENVPDSSQAQGKSDKSSSKEDEPSIF